MHNPTSPQYNSLHPSNHSNPFTCTDIVFAVLRGISPALINKAAECCGKKEEKGRELWRLTTTEKEEMEERRD